MKNSLTSIGDLSSSDLASVISDELWKDRLHQWADRPFGIHVAVFSEPFLGYVLAGTKTVDSRFSKHRISPYGHVVPGDVILIKATSGPVVGLCGAEKVWSYELDPTIFQDIQSRFGDSICADEAFWKSRYKRAYCTLILLQDVRSIDPFSIDKKDRRGWVTVKNRHSDNSFVIALAGRIGAGKTTLSRALAKYFQCKRVSFGDHFRQLALHMGHDPSDRNVLQQIGEQHVQLSPDSLCRDLLGDWKVKRDILIVDGIRHVEILDALRRAVSPLPLLLIYVERDDIRTNAAEAEIGRDNLTLFDSHSTEMQSNVLRLSADLVTTSSTTFKEVISQVLSISGGTRKS